MHHRRQRGQDRGDVAAGLQAEDGAAVVEQVELHVAPAPHELLLALRLRPGLGEVGAHDARIDVEEGAAHILREGEPGVPAALCLRRRQVIVEDAAHPAHLLAMRQEEILVAPGLVAPVVGEPVLAAGSLVGGMKGDCVGIVLGPAGVEHGCQVSAAAEPPFRGHDEPRVHVRRRRVGIGGMRDQRHAGSPEARILLRARDLLAEFGRELAVDRRGVDARLLEHAALDDAHHPAAARRAGVVLPLPGRALEASRRTVLPAWNGRRIVLDALEGHAQIVPQLFEPGLGLALARSEQIGVHAQPMFPSRGVPVDRAGRFVPSSLRTGASAGCSPAVTRPSHCGIIAAVRSQASPFP